MKKLLALIALSCAVAITAGLSSGMTPAKAEPHSLTMSYAGLFDVVDPITGTKFYCTQIGGTPTTTSVSCIEAESEWLIYYDFALEWFTGVVTIEVLQVYVDSDAPEGYAARTAAAAQRAVEAAKSSLGNAVNSTSPSVTARTNGTAPSIAATAPTVAATVVPSLTPAPANAAPSPHAPSRNVGKVELKSNPLRSAGEPAMTAWATSVWRLTVPQIEGQARRIQVDWGDGTKQVFHRSVTDPDVFQVTRHYPGAYHPELDTNGWGSVTKWILIQVTDLDVDPAGVASHSVFLKVEVPAGPPSPPPPGEEFCPTMDPCMDQTT